MGITNFHIWLKSYYPDSYIQIKNNNCYDYMYIDVNFILHNAMHGSKSFNEFLKRIHLQFDTIFSNVIATKQIYFALDGPSSYAKILLQRKRREVAGGKVTNTKINSLYITPGIEKMKEIEDGILLYINKLKSKYKLIKPELIISSASEPDEGEIKICHQLIKNGINNLNAKHLIVGNDSDLIVLAMGMKPIYNINILVRAHNENSLISLKELLKLHATNIEKNAPIEDLAKSSIRDDFVLISLMMGNDYLPKLGYLNYIRLWDTYYYVVKNINTEDNLVNEDSSFNMDMIQTLFYNLYNKLSHGQKKTTIQSYQKKRSKSYLEGLLWCLKMYQTGKCPKYDYIYLGDQSPHPYEILLYLQCETEKFNICSNTDPIPANIYPLLVMPKSASFLIHDKYQEFVDHELKYLYEMEECTVCANYRTEIKKLYGQEELKKQYHTTIINSTNHKKTHHKFNVEDIHKIIDLTKKISLTKN